MPKHALATRSGCPLLRYLDLRTCNHVDDQIVGIFAKHCRNLRHLNVKYLKDVTDVGILKISEGCRNMESLVLSRNELPFKVTDVGMLALRERCAGLTELHVSKCDFMTDVGIHWLSEGCQALRV